MKITIKDIEKNKLIYELSAQIVWLSVSMQSKPSFDISSKSAEEAVLDTTTI